MFSDNNKISLRQLQTLLILDVLGIGITVLPRQLADLANQDGWLLIISGGILAIVAIFLISALVNKFPNLSFREYSSLIVSKPLSFVLTLIFAFKLIVFSALQLRAFGEIVKEFLLFETPIYWVTFLLLLLCIYTSYKGYEVRGRLGEILIYIVLIPLCLVFLFTLRDVDFSNLKPFFNLSSSQLVNGSFFTMFLFSSVELLLLASPYISNIKNVRNSAISAIIFSAVILLVITALVIARFGIFDVKNQIYPVLEIMDTIDIPGSFIERQNALVMSFWIISTFMIISGGLFFSSHLISSCACIDKLNQKSLLFVLISAILIYITSFVPVDINSVYNYLLLLNLFFSTFFMFTIPLLLLIIANIRKIGGNKK